MVDGFPRNQDNFEGWMREMGNKAKVHFVLYLSCPEDVCLVAMYGSVLYNGIPGVHVSLSASWPRAYGRQRRITEKTHSDLS
ncbi:unnamed protein product [Anisakis simplex]|uniref:Uncharacterized protein n=1 Tax=Anisakis simplex TaxID=6269 RepID=A0A3P6QJJ6_ANISI|nr:unnamed protein product [Anisakis simplex]